ncbi:MAG: 6-carboxytetrahydropterin synthase [Phycisphaeraceae bacterium]
MLEMTRTVRFCVEDGVTGTSMDAPLGRRRDNTYSAWPAMRGLGRYYELSVTCRGEVDPQTGYCINIHEIDDAVREHVLADFEELINSPSSVPSNIAMGELMQRLVRLLFEPLGDTVSAVTLHLTPRYTMTIWSDAMEYVVIRQQYEFSAAHRLHVAELSDAENERIFGKCNNPAGHGHNYRLEVAVRAPIDETGRSLDVEELDATVREHVVDRLDHKHLNTDVAAFAQLNPSVENIAQVIWTMLAGVVRDVGPAAEAATLEEVRVWETEKTVCTYRGE